MDANPGASDCCHEKNVGDKTYTFLKASDETSKYGCHDACIYQDKMKPGSKFCFTKGKLQSTCRRKSNCKCGVKRKGTRIIDGQESEVNEYPWMVRLFISYVIDGTQEIHSCGGSLIASRWVLTASHCLIFPWDAKNSTITALVGFHNADLSPPESPGVKDLRTKRDALYWEAHPYYNTFFANDNDIGLVFLNASVDINVYTPVCLPWSGLDLDIDGKTAWLTGWGGNSSYKGDPTVADTEADWQFTNAETLMEKQLVIEDRNKCYDFFQKYKFRANFTMGMLCAKSTNFEGEKNAGQCAGDSGGPLTIEDKDGRHVLVGDVSFGPRPCEEVNTIGAYGNVAFFIDYIERTMKIVQEEEPEKCDDDYEISWE